MAEGQPSSRRILLGDASSGVGGWLLGQGICLSDYHNNSYARLAFVFGIALIAMPQVSPIYRAMAESIPAAWKGRLQNTAPYAGVVVQIVAITLGVVLAIRIYKLPQPQETVSQYQWNALNAAQKADLNTVIRRLPKRRVLVIRPDTPDCAVLADSIADVLQQQSELLAPLIL
jgi:hypothetical protein